MANSKVILDGETIIDLTSDTVVPSAVMSGHTATSANGERIYGIGSKVYANEFISRTIGSRYENSTASCIGKYAFGHCVNITEVSMTNCISIYDYAFTGCTALKSVYIPNTTSIYSYAFVNCTNLESVTFPNVVKIDQRAFYMCGMLSFLSFPMVEEARFYAFSCCYSLSTAVFHKMSSVLTGCFDKCSRLISLYLLSNSVVKIADNVFSSTPIAGYSTVAGQYGNVYVRASLLTAYQADSVWSSVSSRIIGLTDSQISDLHF